ncbi:MAG: hypothetical protein WAV13_13725, partial [Thermodesulfovibrionales bacterium]
MGEIIKRKIRGMSWMSKISLVLIFTMMFSIFMYEGWYEPKPASAAVASLNTWTNVLTNTIPNTISYTTPTTGTP